jgi:HD-GYP domain-containing protein (c-di-GMP phosphodiesterase class II)
MLTLQQRGAWAAIVLLAPLLILALVSGILPDPKVGAPLSHFAIVTITTILLALVALVMVAVALRVGDLRVTLLALAFLSLSGILLAHALTTPTALVPYPNGWVTFSSPFSVFICATLLAFSTRRWSSRAESMILQRQGILFAVAIMFLVLYNVAAVVSASQPPETVVTPVSAASADDGYGRANDPHEAHGATTVATASPRFDQLLGNALLQRGIAGFTVACLGFAIWHYAGRYRLARSPLVAGLLAATIFLVQAQVIMVTTVLWRTSWWTYHLLILAAFGAAAIGLAREYGRSGNLAGVMQGLIVQDTIRQLEHGYTEVITALVAAVEAKDPYTRGHTQRVAELSVSIGQHLGLSPERLRVLNQAAILHDIGKIGVPDAILNKPGPLTDAEFAAVREHPVRGYEIVKPLRSLQRELGGIRWHHERIDGSGYPDGLRGETIPLEARIIAVADVYDALTSRRPYRDAMHVARALAIIGADAPSRLDEQCVAALRQVLVNNAAPALLRPEQRLASPFTTNPAD